MLCLPGVLVDGAELLELPVADGDDVLGEECDGGHVGRPDDVAALGDLDVAQVPLLLHVEQRHRVRVAQQEHARACVDRGFEIF